MKRFFILMLMIFAMFSCTEVSEDTDNNDNYNDNYSDNTTNDNTNTDNNTNNDNYNDNYNDNNTNTSYTVYFYAGEVNWDEVYVYSWYDEYNKNKDWPGERMSSDGNGWYSATVNYPNIIFNDNYSSQTGNLTSQDGYFVPENSGSSISGTWYTSKPNVGNNPEPDYPDYPDDPEPDYPDDPYYPDEPEEISAPSSLSAYATSESSISLSWSYVSGATYYKVYYGTSNSSYYAKCYDSYYDTSAQITGLSAGTTYYFWVKATNDSQESDFSSMEYATTEKSSTATIYFAGYGNLQSSTKCCLGITSNQDSQYSSDCIKSSKLLTAGTVDGPYTISAGIYFANYYTYSTGKGSGSNSYEQNFEEGKIYTIYLSSKYITLTERYHTEIFIAENAELPSPGIYKASEKLTQLTTDKKGFSLRIGDYPDPRAEKFRLYRSQEKFENYEMIKEVNADNFSFVFEDRTVDMTAGNVYYYRVSAVCGNNERQGDYGMEIVISNPIVKPTYSISSSKKYTYDISFDGGNSYDQYTFSKSKTSYSVELEPGSCSIYAALSTADEWSILGDYTLSPMYTYTLSMSSGITKIELNTDCFTSFSFN